MTEIRELQAALQSDRNALRGRRHDGSGRGQHGEGVQRRADADRRRACQGRRRRTGGAALSVRSITGKPIKFLGMGEKIDALEPFSPGSPGLAHPRHGRRALADRGGRAQGRQAEGADARQEDSDAARSSTWKISAISSIRWPSMGGVTSMLDKMPGMGNLPARRPGAARRRSFQTHGRHHRLDDTPRARVSPTSSTVPANSALRAAAAPRCPTSTACSSSTSRCRR